MYTHLSIYQSVLAFQELKNVTGAYLFFTGACNESVNMRKQLHHVEYIQKSICPRFIPTLLGVGINSGPKD